MKRVSGLLGPSGEEPSGPEALETEGERQLRSLLRHQLDPSASLERCLSQRSRFAPAALFQPSFGEEAAGARSLTHFQALQQRNREEDALRDMGLSDAERRLWRGNRDGEEQEEQSPGLGAAPEARQDRLRAIQEKIAERQRILALPQRFAGSKPLSRREMEIERSLFQGTDRHAFLRGLYHQGEAVQKDSSATEGPAARLETLYQEVLAPGPPREPLPEPHTHGTDSAPPPETTALVTRPVTFIPEEEICQSRLSEEEIRQIPRFASYDPGEPSQVLYLKNLSRQVTVEDLMSVFARFQEKEGPQIRFRLLSGRMRGQAFLTFPSISVAQAALQLANGYHLLGKPLVIEFGKSKRRPEPTPSPGTPAPPSEEKKLTGVDMAENSKRHRTGSTIASRQGIVFSGERPDVGQPS